MRQRCAACEGCTTFDPIFDSRTDNLSTRARVETGQGLLIGWTAS